MVVYFHGGSFCMNSSAVYHQLYRYLAAFEDVVVVAADYRLAPEFRFPAGLEDAYRSLTWAKANAEKYGGNPQQLVVAGDSSGGNFSTVVAQMCRDRGGASLSGQVLVYPVVSLDPGVRLRSEVRYGTGYFFEYDSAASPFGFYLDDETGSASPLVSPLEAPTLEGLPPALIIGAECDPLLDQGLMYAARLSDEGVGVEYRLAKGMIHGFLNRPYAETFECLHAIGKFAHNGLSSPLRKNQASL